MPKIGKGCPIRSQTQEVLFNVKRYFEEEKCRESPNHPYSKVMQRVASATGIGLNTVRKVCKQAERASNEGTPFPLDTPGKKKPRESKISHPDSFALEAIRRTIHKFYIDGQLPTLKRLLMSLRNSDDGQVPIFSGKKESLRVLLTTHLGFKFKKLNNRKHLLERTDVVAARHDYLRKMRNVQLEKVYFLDETWINKNHTVSKCWQSVECNGIEAPIGKGERLILLHVGSCEGFVNNCVLLFPSKSGKADYHEDMNADCFTEWFTTQLLPNIPPHSIIVMDNASYHSTLLEKAPVSNSLKKDMQDWLRSKDIPFDANMLKAELYEIIKMYKPQTKRYVIDEMAAAAPHFHTIIRLPPYHCQFNPIELIWAEVKRYVAERNCTFTLSAAKILTIEALSSITPESWGKAVNHVKKEMEEYWKNDPQIETNIEPLIISLNGDSSSESDSGSTSEDEDDFESAFHPL